MMARCIFLSSVTALSTQSRYTPSKIVEIASLAKRRWHVAIFVVLRRLSGEIDQAFIDSQLLLHTTGMLLRYRASVSDFLM
jgi:hypothetical protein